LKSFFYSAFFALALFFFGNPVFGQSKKRSYFDSLGIMPSFRFYLANGTVFTPDSILDKATTVLIYFRTDCPFCEREAEVVSKNMNEFQSVEFIFIARSDTADMRRFAEAYKLENNARVKFLQDKEKLYYKFYAASMTPSIHIYDRNKKLKLFKEGFLNKEELLKFIQ
jgi:thiol-disulfide isomerase/thioredoxin